MTRTKPAIIVISSHVVRGTVGNRAAAFALEVMGHPVWTVPTVTLPWHPGHTPHAGAGGRIVAPDAQFSAMLEQLAGSPWNGEVGAVLSGYLGSAGQVPAVAKLIRSLKSHNPRLLYALDPVIGDHGKLYVPETQATAMREHLLPLADIITPNPFELSWFAGSKMPARNEELLHLARRLAAPTTLVTSADGLRDGHIGNLLLHGETAHLAEHRRMEGPPNGLGDLTAALFLGHRLAGASPPEAMVSAVGSVHDVMMHTLAEGSDELLLESAIRSLLTPRAKVSLRTLA